MIGLGTRTRYRWLYTRFSVWTEAHLNFYRVHLLSFTLIPVLSAAIFYASNGRTKISYLDSLFMCTSAMTTSGLNTVNLSTTTVWQQVILTFLMFIGNSTSVSFIVLMIRKSYFKSKCEAAVKQSRQQRHERDLIRHAMSRGGGTPGVFGRIRTRAQTILGWQPTPIIEPRPEAREEGPPVVPPEKQLRGRARGETITTSYHGTTGSDDTHIDRGENVGSGSGFGKTFADESSSAHAGGHQPQPDSNASNNNGFLPPTFTKTAPTPPPTLGLHPDGLTTESPTDELDQPPLLGIDAALADHSGDVEGQLNSDARSKPRPNSLALGHESDRNVLRPRNRAGAIRIGEHGMVETESPEVEFGDHPGRKIGEDGVIIDSPIKSSPLSEDRIVSTSPQDWYPKQGGIESVGVGAGTDETRPKDDPSPTSPKSPSSAAQVLTSNLSPRSETFATSPKAMSEFAPSETGAQLSPVQEQGQPIIHLSPAPPYNSLAPSEHAMPPRKSTMSSTTSRSPVTRPTFLHAPQVVPHARRTTFAEQVHPLHPNGPANNGDYHRRPVPSRPRNGTINSPMIPPTHMPAHDIGPSPLSLGATHHGKHPNSEGYGHHLHSHHPPRPHRAHTGMGGLPGPTDLMHWGIERLPGLKQFIGEHEREVVNETESKPGRRGSAYPRTDSVRSNGTAPVAPDVDDISLEEDELEEMGGDEYNALVVLSWLVAGHYFLNHAIAFTILAPYSAKVPLVRDVIEAQNESSGRKLNTTWFALFSVISAYANAGLTVVDTSLIQMSSAYVMIFVIIWLILVGATAFPLSLRFFVWVGTKIFRHGSTAKGLRFLLRHPRRCFMYLFPAHQSWYLLFTLIVIFLLDWVAYLTFNIDMPGIESVPTGPRVVGGFLQAVGQRAGGFTTINLQAIAPALQVVYIATMFVQVYPIAMAVRTSNVYEESGVVIYEPEKDDEEPTNLSDGRGTGFTAYLGWHLKHQLAQDLFWLIAALTALCAFERKRILSEETSYFNIFSLFFEIVSAFANVGFSLGVSSQPFSLSGEMRTIPKLVIIGLMIRGRHRGLPMAIDRAVQLPTEYKTTSHVTSPSGISSRRSTGAPMSRRATVGTWTRTTVRQRQRAQDPTLDSDEED